MEKIHTNHLFVILLMLYAPIAVAQEIEFNGICYNITSMSEKTAEVTYGKN